MHIQSLDNFRLQQEQRLLKFKPIETVKGHRLKFRFPK